MLTIDQAKSGEKNGSFGPNDRREVLSYAILYRLTGRCLDKRPDVVIKIRTKRGSVQLDFWTSTMMPKYLGSANGNYVYVNYEFDQFVKIKELLEKRFVRYVVIVPDLGGKLVEDFYLESKESSAN